MKSTLIKLLPLLIMGCVLGVVLIAYETARQSKGGILNRMEWATYDLRVKLAYDPAVSHRIATNLACVYLDEATISAVDSRFGTGPVLPRFVYGYALDELAAQGAKAVAFDVWFNEVSHDCDDMRRKILFDSGSSDVSSDGYLGRSLRRYTGGILSAPSERDNPQVFAGILPLLHTNATSVGHTASDRDDDGVYRRVPLLIHDRAGNRVWNLGVSIAAHELGLDLAGAQVFPGEKIVIRGTNKPGVTREIPMFRNGTALIDWVFRIGETNLYEDGLWSLVEAARDRATGNPRPADFKDKLVLIGSIAHGNNMADIGVTPLLKSGYLMHTHVNVANSLITGRVPQRASSLVDLALITCMTLVAGLASWRLRVMLATVAIGLMAIGYTALSIWAWTEHRYWIPVVIPVGGALAITYVVLVVYRVVFERAELRRVRSRLRRLVAPDVMQLVLESPTEPLRGTHRELTVMFADLRGFTALTDSRHRAASEEVQRRQLAPTEANAFMASAAQESMKTVNLYLATVAETIKAHGGTLDKYIGDCVMAFWGAPLAEDFHAAKAVRAAVAIQHAIKELNTQRSAENVRCQSGQLPLLPLLEIGIGMNTGAVTVGFMGSDQHVSNYTVFGREVNIAARLEGFAPGGAIRITAATHAALQRTEPKLAGLCQPMDALALRGIATPVQVFAVEAAAHPV